MRGRRHSESVIAHTDAPPVTRGMRRSARSELHRRVRGQTSPGGMSNMQRFLWAVAAVALAVASFACGGDNPSGASGAVTLRGTVVGQGTASAASERAGSGARITV